MNRQENKRHSDGQVGMKMEEIRKMETKRDDEELMLNGNDNKNKILNWVA